MHFGPEACDSGRLWKKVKAVWKVNWYVSMFYGLDDNPVSLLFLNSENGEKIVYMRKVLMNRL